MQVIYAKKHTFSFHRNQIIFLNYKDLKNTIVNPSRIGKKLILEILFEEFHSIDRHELATNTTQTTILSNSKTFDIFSDIINTIASTSYEEFRCPSGSKFMEKTDILNTYISESIKLIYPIKPGAYSHCKGCWGRADGCSSFGVLVQPYFLVS